MRNTIATALAVACLILAGCGDSGPKYKGKTFAEWVEIADDKNYETSSEAREAIFNLAIASSGDSPEMRKLCEILPSLNLSTVSTAVAISRCDSHWDDYRQGEEKPYFIQNPDTLDRKALYLWEAEKLAKP